MGLRGPLPLPKAVRLAEGTYRRDRHGESYDVPVEIPVAPEWLSPQEKVLFAAVTETLSRVPGLLTALDGPALARYAADWVVYLKSRDTIDNEGEDVRTGKGAVYQHPAVGRMNKANARLAKFESCFGMTPADRAAIGRAAITTQKSGVACRTRIDG